MKKFFLMLAAVALASSAMLAQTNGNNGTVEEPDRVQLKATMSMNPTGSDIPTGISPREQVKHECKDHKDGQPCTKPANQQCPDCKAKAEGMKDCKKGEGPKHECKEGMKPECKKGEGHECKKGEGHECKKGEGPKHECKEGMKDCKKGEGPKGMKIERKKAESKIEKTEGMKLERKGGEFKKGEAPKHECKEGTKECEKAEMMKKHEECKDHKDGQPCTKPADQQCPDCKAKAEKKD